MKRELTSARSDRAVTDHAPYAQLQTHAVERYARLSNQKVKQVYLQTIKKVIQKTKV